MKDFQLNNPLLTQEQYDQMYAESFAIKNSFGQKLPKNRSLGLRILLKLKIPTMREMFLLNGLRMVN
jgi:hypothetical protein